MDKVLLWIWSNAKQLGLWFTWIGLTSGFVIYCLIALRGEASPLFLPGKTSDGHFQIEPNCRACHELPFGGVQQEKCLGCHAEELLAVDDTHRLVGENDASSGTEVHAKLDTGRCVSCHQEHEIHPLGGNHRGGFLRVLSWGSCHGCPLP